MGRRKESLLWEITPPGGCTSWLFGTMHVRDDRVHRLTRVLEPLIRSVDVYVGEMDIPDAPLEVRAEFRISEALPARTYARVRTQLIKSFGLDIRTCDLLHPLVVSGLLSQRVLSSDHAVSLDERLIREAREAGIAVTGLESMEEQIEILGRIDPLPVCRQLVRLARRPGSLRRQTQATVEAYLRGDLRGLYQRTRRSLHGLRGLVLDDRNKRMVRRLVEQDSTRRYFVAVGAAHLAGRYGLLASLRRLGWKVAPMPLAPDPAP